MKYIYVVTGGTMVHVRPHFSLCAPAYGQVGAEIYDGLEARLARRQPAADLEVHLVRTRMAGSTPAATAAHLQALGVPTAPETNAELKTLVQGITARPETVALVMAAAVCDFEPVELRVEPSGIAGHETSREGMGTHAGSHRKLLAAGETGTKTSTTFGKSQPRLHHIDTATLTLRPTEKLVDLVKVDRPEVCLVTFKTTAGVSESELVAQATHNLHRSRSDLVFANDIQTRLNLVLTASGGRLQGPDRQATVGLLCDRLLSTLLKPGV